MISTPYDPAPARATPSAPTRRTPRSFLVAGIFAVMLTALTAPLGLLDWLPVIGLLLERGGAVSVIAVLVVAISLWIVLFAVGRLATGRKERTAVARVRVALTSVPPASSADALSKHLLRALSAAARQDSLVARRVGTLEGSGKSGQDGARTALSSRSELDHALGEVFYLPARALVWALPALGFLGTAAEMSRAVGGLGNSVGATTGYANLRNTLVSEVIPPLADAFGVTLFALGAGVLCHLLLTWTDSRDQRILLDVEEATLEILDRVSPVIPATLNGQIDILVSELSRTRSTMMESAGQVAALDLGQLSHLQQLAPLLQSVVQRLDQIHAELSQELVITRLGSYASRS
ncbi:MotA/TolQ/ExbB proton channel family protein [Acrocarpospora macrocephala]|uniref:MotA/TolQ/ExbB proton channel domain-containing protein n=1 Tax=Acrocarpospora macrocephala TaxID=150177 RepID=A0A5M3X981_9ACTN|nr:hypothetical protein [Acrocarpospora macrocephala]GES16719.1 hypothetical protein Amac_103170 [Acrocarpospora macrocephala]